MSAHPEDRSSPPAAVFVPGLAGHPAEFDAPARLWAGGATLRLDPFDDGDLSVAGQARRVVERALDAGTPRTRLGRTTPVNRTTTAHHRRSDAGPLPGPSRATTAATAVGVVGGLALFADLGLHAFGPLGRSYSVVATVMALCLLGVPAAFWLRGAVGRGWRRGLAVTGTALIVLGVAAWVTAFVILFGDPGAAFTQRLTPAGSALMALGMLLLGTAVLASRRLSRPRAVAPLVVGLYFPAQLAVQLASFLGGRDGDPGPNGLLLGAWGLLWAWAALAAGTARTGLGRP